jgi:hypothetical protein
LCQAAQFMVICFTSPTMLIHIVKLEYPLVRLMSCIWFFFFGGAVLMCLMFCDWTLSTLHRSCFLHDSNR